ncbi:MAG: hypothetical protein D6781_02775 [Verrucomicrobia bacterium]|nr:MAG: hypothetical protein D6781_02775 [Verrucomicrobiota bacterium]
MAARTLFTTAIILDRDDAGEKFARHRAICPEHGILVCLQRLARKSPGRIPVLDLFDEAQLTLESANQGRTWFIRDALPVKKRPDLGRRYDVLLAACRFARILADNPVHEESRAAVFALLRRALDAWQEHARPDITYLKSLYLLARDEGYPVRENWRCSLDREERDLATGILARPLDAQTAEPPEVRRLTRALEEYLHQEAGFRIPPPP